MDHARTPPPRLSERSTLPLPEGLEEILLACLAKTPDDRPQSAEDVAAALERVAVTDAWTPERARRWWQEHREVVASLEEPTVAVAGPPAATGRKRGQCASHA